MGKRGNKKKGKGKRHDDHEEDGGGANAAAVAAQCARLRKMRLTAEAAGTEGQEHPNDDLVKAEQCGFRVVALPTPTQVSAALKSIPGVPAEAAAAIGQYFSSGSEDEAHAEVVERTDDAFFIAMHAPLEAMEAKQNAAEALHLDNGTKRRGVRAVRRSASHSHPGSSEDEDEDADGTEGEGAALSGSGSDAESDLSSGSFVEVEVDGKTVQVEAECRDSLQQIKLQASYLSIKKVCAKIEQQGWRGLDRKLVATMWAQMGAAAEE